VVFFPISDENKTRWIRHHYVTTAIVVACALVFLWQDSLAEREFVAFTYRYGLVPAVLFGSETLPPRLGAADPLLTLLTSQFLHGSWLHLFSNMLFLWVFGDNVEDSMGHVKFAAFYLLCGALAGVAHAVSLPDSTLPTVGASGAVAGVLGAYFVLHPRVRVWVISIIPIPFRLPAFLLLGVWIGMELLNALYANPEEVEVAFWAHIGGFAAGAILVRFFKRASVPLWAQDEVPTHRVAGLRFRRRGPGDGAGPWGRR